MAQFLSLIIQPTASPHRFMGQGQEVSATTRIAGSAVDSKNSLRLALLGQPTTFLFISALTVRCGDAASSLVR